MKPGSIRLSKVAATERIRDFSSSFPCLPSRIRYAVIFGSHIGDWFGLWFFLVLGSTAFLMLESKLVLSASSVAWSEVIGGQFPLCAST